MAALPGFPDLKVKDWMPVLMAHLRLKEKLPQSDELYRKIHDFCKNTRVRRNKKQQEQQRGVGEPSIMADPSAAVDIMPDNDGDLLADHVEAVE